MTTELDLIEEFSALTADKIQGWGDLPQATERRWQELKAFYDELMKRRSHRKVAPSDRFSTTEIRDRLGKRALLRVPAQMKLFFCHRESYAPARSVNLSRGGLFFGSELALPSGTPLTIYLPNLGRGYEHLFETSVDVVWSAADEEPPHRGMGARFRELGSDAQRELDNFIVAFLRERLSKSNPIERRPGWFKERSAVV